MQPRHITTTFKTKNRTEKLILLREAVLYGLSIEIAKSDKASINRGIVSTPNFVFYSNNTKCLIDYTNQINSEVEERVNQYFSQVPVDTNLTIYNGFYADVNSTRIADLSGTYTFKSYFNGIVETSVVSVNSLSTLINRYDRNRFENIPYIVANNIEDGPTKTIIKNKFGKDTKNSFNYLGVKIGDYIKLTDLETPIKVTEMNIDSDGNEFLVVDGLLNSSDLTNKKTKIQIYIITGDEVNTLPNSTETETGCCFEYFNNVIISCTNNHTLSQCRFRSSKEKNIISVFKPNQFCTTPETSKAVQVDTTESLIQVTNSLANALSSVNTISGPVLRSGNSKNSFYGRPF